MIDLMQEKVNRYCNENKEKELDVTLYDVHKMLKKDSYFWNISCMLYGQWINSQSDFVGVEFSKGNFDMAEYQTEKDI